jgi:hypothetical protein
LQDSILELNIVSALILFEIPENELFLANQRTHGNFKKCLKISLNSTNMQKTKGLSGKLFQQ